MRIKLTSIMVDDQDKALSFYTGVLGFVKKMDFPVGEYRWITVVSPEGPGDLEAEYARLRAAGVAFTQPPTAAGPVRIAVFADTCGNLIQLYQPPA